MTLQKQWLLLVIMAGAIQLFAQDVVDVNMDINHKVGDVGEFDRAKYIVIHDDVDGNEWDSDGQRKSFFDDYDVYMGRNNGSIVWEYNNTKADPNKAGWPDVSYIASRGTTSKSNYASNTKYHGFEDRYKNMMIGGQEFMYPHGQATSPGGLVYSGHEATAEFYANYIKNFFGEGGNSGKPMPKMLEVCNEPFVKSGQLGVTNEILAEYHNAVAKRVKEVNPNIMVGGYSAAHPAFEASDFNLWDQGWRMFIDVAGENMDFFSFHLYDFVQSTDDMTTEMYRSGSNIEGIMDMINHYSYLSLGETKPWSVSEYGWLCKTCDGGYDIKEDWYNLRSFNNMMVQLMERPEQIINAIPFMLLKANWAKPADSDYNTYGPRILREIGEVAGEPAHGGFVYSELIKYYEFWKDVKGTRVDTKSQDLDMMADAYIDGKAMYLILSNLEKEEKDVDLNLLGANGNTVEGIMVKHMYAINDIPQLDTTYYSNAINSIKVGAQATMILEYSLSDNVVINQAADEKTYWANRYLRTISSGRSNTYTFENVNKVSHGEAILRLGLGRDHGLSLNPEIKVNGTAIDLPRKRDWRGYDQGTRDSYFGVIEIELPYSLVQNGENQISVKFSDDGGKMTSVALQMFNFSREVSRFSDAAGGDQISLNYEAFAVQPNPADNLLNIRTDIEGLISYSIVNMQGQIIREESITDREINISALEEGFYCLSLSSENHNQNLKLIVK